MTEKTASMEKTVKIEEAVSVKKAPAKKASAKKTTAKKAPAKKARVRKAPVEKTVFEKLEDSVIAMPFKAANKTFLASLGFLSVVQKEVGDRIDEFGNKFDKYAKDGEKVLDEYEHKFDDFRKDVVGQVTEARDKVRETFGKAA